MKIRQIVLVCLITALAPDAVRADITNPAAWWRLDEGTGTNASDSSGNAKHGTLANGAGWTAGKLAQAVNLDGSNDQVTLPTSLGINNVSAFSISMWVKQASLNEYRILFSQRATDDNTRIEIFTSGFGAGGSNDLQIAICNGAPFQEGYSTSNLWAADGVWRHVAVVYDGSQSTNAGKLKLYVDGTQQTLTFAQNIPSTSANIASTASYLGRRGDAGTNPFPGAIDDARIYARALTQSDVTELYNWRGNTPHMTHYARRRSSP